MEGLREAMSNDNIDLKTIGNPCLLPSSKVGSPRWYHAKYQDAMTIVQSFRKPDLFITFTCNPKWPEITDNLFLSQSAYDRPGLVARVFSQKKNELMDDLKHKGIFGRTVAHVETVEFQKRGLPHIHILLILSNDDSLKCSDHYDKIVSAEIPDEKTCPRLHKAVMKHMIHHHTSHCYRDGSNQCSKFFPKKFVEETIEAEDGYPSYKRRSPEQVLYIFPYFFKYINLQFVFTGRQNSSDNQRQKSKTISHEQRICGAI